MPRQTGARNHLIVSVAILCGLLGICIAPAHRELQAQTEFDTDWELLFASNEAVEFAVTSDALFVNTRNGLWRSSASELSWKAVPIPVDRIGSFASHPTDPSVLYESDRETFRSRNGGEDWERILDAGGIVKVSPGDPDLVYVVGPILYRSRDGGTNWTSRSLFPNGRPSPCTDSFPIINPDPRIPDRIYLLYGCFAGRNYTGGFGIWRSDDAWQSNGSVVFTTSRTAPTIPEVRLAVPQDIAFNATGDRGVVLIEDYGGYRGRIARTDDGGLSWRIVQPWPDGPSLAITDSLAVDSGLDRIFLGLRQRVILAGVPPDIDRGVLGTLDGGATWGPIGTQPIGLGKSLFYAEESDILYALTDRGLWRMRSPRPAILPREGQRLQSAGLGITTKLTSGLVRQELGLMPNERTSLRVLNSAENGGIIVAPPLIQMDQDGHLHRLAEPALLDDYISAIAPSVNGAVLYANILGDVRVFELDHEGNRLLLVGRPNSRDVPRDVGVSTDALELRLRMVRGLAFDARSELVYIADSQLRVVYRLDRDGRIQIAAGIQEAGIFREGMPATSTPLGEPIAIVVDPQGRLIIADRGTHRILRVESDGTVRTLAGTGFPGYWGDGGPGNAARLTYPSGLAVDPAGRIFVADTWNHAIRMIDLDGTIWTIMGTGVRGTSEDGPIEGGALNEPVGLAWSDGGLYVSEAGTSSLKWIGPLP
jgi:DNA-binding beta-propeller fold protein YncE